MSEFSRNSRPRSKEPCFTAFPRCSAGLLPVETSADPKKHVMSAPAAAALEALLSALRGTFVLHGTLCARAHPGWAANVARAVLRDVALAEAELLNVLEMVEAEARALPGEPDAAPESKPGDLALLDPFDGETDGEVN